MEETEKRQPATGEPRESRPKEGEAVLTRGTLLGLDANATPTKWAIKI